MRGGEQQPVPPHRRVLADVLLHHGEQMRRKGPHPTCAIRRVRRSAGRTTRRATRGAGTSRASPSSAPPARQEWLKRSSSPGGSARRRGRGRGWPGSVTGAALGAAGGSHSSRRISARRSESQSCASPGSGTSAPRRCPGMGGTCAHRGRCSASGSGRTGACGCCVVSGIASPRGWTAKAPEGHRVAHEGTRTPAGPSWGSSSSGSAVSYGLADEVIGGSAGAPESGTPA